LIEKRIADCTGCSSCWHLSLSIPQLSITCCTSSSAVAHFFLPTLEIKKERKEWTGRGNPRETLRSCGRETDRLECGRQAERQRIKIFSTHPPQKDTRMEIYQSADFDPYRCDVLVGSRLPATVFDRSAKILSLLFISVELLDEKTRSQSNG
jgi:hypothetical protein